jgi:hypothetical protein
MEYHEEGMFCQHGGDPDRCIVCNPETGDPTEWNETHMPDEDIARKWIITLNSQDNYYIIIRAKNVVEIPESTQWTVRADGIEIVFDAEILSISVED